VKQRPQFTGPVVIVGNGGSVDAMPPDFWHQPGVSYVGTNRCLALAACQTVEWSALVMRDSYRGMFRMGSKTEGGWRYHEQLWKPATAWKVGSSSDRGVWSDEFVRPDKGWQAEWNFDLGNREAAVMKNSSVVLMAANWAWLCGARRLYLIGVDYRMPHHGKMIEPWCRLPQGNDKQYERPVPGGTEKQFAKAVAAVDSLGGVMVNLSPGTALKAVPMAKGIAA
jgi:hypothetical protein